MTLPPKAASLSADFCTGCRALPRLCIQVSKAGVETFQLPFLCRRAHVRAHEHARDARTLTCMRRARAHAYARTHARTHTRPRSVSTQCSAPSQRHLQSGGVEEEEEVSARPPLLSSPRPLLPVAPSCSSLPSAGDSASLGEGRREGRSGGGKTAGVVGPRDRLPFLASWHAPGRETESRRRKSGCSPELTPRALEGLRPCRSFAILHTVLPGMADPSQVVSEA